MVETPRLPAYDDAFIEEHNRYLRGAVMSSSEVTDGDRIKHVFGTSTALFIGNFYLEADDYPSDEQLTAHTQQIARFLHEEAGFSYEALQERILDYLSKHGPNHPWSNQLITSLKQIGW